LGLLITPLISLNLSHR